MTLLVAFSISLARRDGKNYLGSITSHVMQICSHPASGTVHRAPLRLALALPSGHGQAAFRLCSFAPCMSLKDFRKAAHAVSAQGANRQQTERRRGDRTPASSSSCRWTKCATSYRATTLSQAKPGRHVHQQAVTEVRCNNQSEAS